MSELTPHQRRALNYKNHISLTANAGSGKTFVLSKRFVEILLNENVELNNLVAITFTDKAAGELSKRIARELDERIAAEKNKAVKKKLESIRSQLVSANISTIHSFCNDILKEFAPEADLDANFIPVDQETADELVQLSVEEMISDSFKENGSGAVKELIRFFGSKRNFASQIESLVKNRKNVLRINDIIYSGTTEDIAQNFRNMFENNFEEIFGRKISAALKSAKRINDEALAQNPSSQAALNAEELIGRLNAASSAIDKLLLLHNLDAEILTKTEGTVKKTGYLKKDREVLANEINAVEDILNELRKFEMPKNPGEAEQSLALTGKQIMQVFLNANERYDLKKKQKGYIDYEDMLLKTQHLLTRDDVKEYLGKKFRYIMVDEYQDTNEIQYEIFMPILDNLKTGNLFVVGDEKQSIYMFRDAELEIFNRTKEEIKTLETESSLLNLPHSFRMAPGLVLFTNKLFSSLLSNPNPAFNEVEYNDLVCARDESEPASVEILLAAREDESVSESRNVSARILNLVEEKNLRFSDVAVLCRKRDSFLELERAFIKYKIPYTIMGGKGYYQRQIIYDVYNYLSFLINNNDDAALIGILRAPFFTLSDRIIYEISLEDGNTFFAKLCSYSAKGDTLKDEVEMLKSHSELTHSTSITALIRKILADTGYWAVIASKKNSVQEIANLEKLINISRHFSEQHFRNLYDFIVYLQEAISETADESQAVISREENSVKIMTIHKAKGLEFKAVVLYGCQDYARDSRVKSGSLTVDKNFGLLAKVPAENNYYGDFVSAPVTGIYNYISSRKSSAENKRLFYVAVTRAANYLILSAENKNDSFNAESFMGLLIEGLNPDISKESFEISGDVDFMKFSGSEFDPYKKKSSLTVKIIKDAGEPPAVENPGQEEFTKPSLMLGSITDHPKREIISATKIAVFNQCPLKYKFTYELGYSALFDLIKHYRTRAAFEFNSGEDEDVKGYGDVKGRVIHKILELNPERQKLRETADKYISGEFISEISDETSEKLVNEITGLLENFYDSGKYAQLNSYRAYKNEFEIYAEEVENYLYGIIDKLIIENDRIIVVDYKTDNVPESETVSRAEDYFIQLKFYAYILGKYFDRDEFELRIIFIRYPEQDHIKKVARKDLKDFSFFIEGIISKIKNGEFRENFSHCPKCHFALEKDKCVKSIKLSRS